MQIISFQSFEITQTFYSDSDRLENVLKHNKFITVDFRFIINQNTLKNIMPIGTNDFVETCRKTLENTVNYIIYFFLTFPACF